MSYLLVLQAVGAGLVIWLMTRAGGRAPELPRADPDFEYRQALKELEYAKSLVKEDPEAMWRLEQALRRLGIPQD